MRLWLIRLVLCGLLGAGASVDVMAQQAAPAPQRVVSLGASVTEIVYALGQGHMLVGTDLSSQYPPEVVKLPRVGYYRSLSLEGLLSFQSDLILASANAGPPDVLARAEQLGLPVVRVSDKPNMDSLQDRITQIATALQVPQAGQALAQRLRSEIAGVLARAEDVAPDATPVRAVVIVMRSTQMQAAGAGTAAAALLELAGLENALALQRGYRPLSPEGLAALQPDLIITTSASSLGQVGRDAFLQSDAIRLTPAAVKDNVLVMDDALILGFGPRAAQGLSQLVQARDKVRQAP